MQQPVQWSPRGVETAAAAVAGVLLGASLVVLDGPGRVLVGAGALLLLGLAARDAVSRPRLRADRAGVTVTGLTGRHLLPWEGVRVQVREVRRFGLRGRTLELDTSEGADDEGRLIVLGRRDLGADPAEVAEELGRLDPRRE